MALAWLRYEGSENGRARFRADLGTNRYYAFAIGEGDAVRSDGVARLQDPAHVSGVQGPIEESARGRTIVEVPAELFDRKNRAIQLMTFRTKEREGPAISEVVRVPVGELGSDELPEIAFSMSHSMKNGKTPTIPFRYRHRRIPELSKGMFLGSIGSILSGLLPNLGGIVGGLFGGQGGSAPNPSASPVGAAVTQILNNPDVVRTLQDLIGRLSGGSTPPAPAATAHSMSRYSEAQVAPALMAMMPMLAPLLQQALNPETLRVLTSVVDPTKIMGATTEAISSLGRLGLQAQQQLQDHLRALNPGVDDPALDRLLESMSLSYKRSDSVRIHFADVATTMVHGRERLAYVQGRDLAFPVAVETARPLSHAVVRLKIKDPRTLDVLVDKKSKAGRASEGRLSVVPKASRSEARSLKPNEDYLVTIALSWKGKSGKRLGTSMTQMITLVDEFAFDRVEESNELIPLNDVSKYREFWHRAWETTFTKKERRFDLDCEYVYVLEEDRRDNARLETQVRTKRDGMHRHAGRLKTGLVLSPFALNRLLPSLSRHPMLKEAELDALRSPDFIDRFNHAARSKATFRGKAGESAALWIFPEMKIQKIVLKKAVQVNANGHVLDFADHPVHFPMPALVHFVGAGSES